jgi:prepilin-type N-terminal cleavage/methylation domain-containing protein
MNYKLNNRGFSLTEVLMSVGILAVGMIFVAGVFPVGIHFTTIATERTIAAIVADEAFAKIKVYAIGDPNKNVPGNDDVDLSKLAVYELRNFNDTSIFPAVEYADSSEFTYPSDPNIDISQKQYCWSALCRQVGGDLSRLVQVTVFVSRKVGSHLQYPDPDPNGSGDWPKPVKVEVDGVIGKRNELKIDNDNEKVFINDGYTIVDDRTGRIYRVLERYASPDVDDTILLDRDWDDEDWNGETHDPEAVWVVPPPVNGNRYPCIAIYQKVIRF